MPPRRAVVWITATALLLGGFAAAVLTRGLWSNCRLADPSGGGRPQQRGRNASSSLPSNAPVFFTDVTKQVGIAFQHYDPATPLNTIPETMGSGIGWIDYDGDGRLDLLCLQDAPLDGRWQGTALTNKLYRNCPDGSFRDVTERVGLARSDYHMGCAVGDYDNDGWDDLVVTTFRGLVLYHNEGTATERRFVDVTSSAGDLARHEGFATSCAWGDIDNDGLLDLYVCNYVKVDLKRYPQDCILEASGKRYHHQCSPLRFEPVHHKLYRNLGGGKFRDVSAAAGITSAPPAAGLAVAMVDLDQDGYLDIYVANDLYAAYLFHNQGDGTFAERAFQAGCGLDGKSNTLAGMGIAVADIDGRGVPSLFVTNFQRKPNILFANRTDPTPRLRVLAAAAFGTARCGTHGPTPSATAMTLLCQCPWWRHGLWYFQDDSSRSGLSAPSLARLAFGTAFLDADGDGRQDLAVANGHVERFAEVLEKAPYAQRDQFFLGKEGGRFEDISDRAGDYFAKKLVSRGLAVADFDNDGRPDLAVSSNGGPAVLLRNRTRNRNRRLVVELQGVISNRNAIGAVLEAHTTTGKQTHFVIGGGSYLSAGSRRIHIGLGRCKQVDRFVVRWPSGQVDVFGPAPAGSLYRLVEGESTPIRLLEFERRRSN